MKLYQYEKEHLATLRSLAPECTVLLRANGDFPLAEAGKLALFGSGARHTVMGGTGSGEVNTRYFVHAEQGLEAAGFTITSKAWLDGYDVILQDSHKAFIQKIKARARAKHTLAVLEGMGAVMPEPDYELPLLGEGDVAVYILSRNSGEGADRKSVPGDILLSASERRDIIALQRKYKKFLLVLNVGGPVDLSPLDTVENILILSQLGIDTGHILADLILGKAYPSGKLTTTWARWEDYCKVGEFGDKDDTRYYEGVYVGYRYFDTIGRKAMFPFGFGLGYTRFDLSFISAEASGEEIHVNACVKNVGCAKGKETVQLYVSSPGRRLDTPYQALAAFEKTTELAPGESMKLALSFMLSSLASYDEKRESFFLEAGDYVLRLGNGSVNTQNCAIVRLDSDVVTRKVKNCCGDSGFPTWKPEVRENKEQEELPIVTVAAETIKTEIIDYSTNRFVDPAVKMLPDEKLAYINIGSFSGSSSALDTVGNTAQSVAGAAGETTHQLKELGLKPLVMADGPAGLRLSRQYYVDKKGVHGLESSIPQSIADYLLPWQLGLMRLLSRKPQKGDVIQDQYATAIPIGTAIAQSWNPGLAETCGDIVGDEMERFGIHLWLAPALNIHRDIRCGRNFEYFSEDPLISGKFAAAITRGVQKHPGCGTTIKHYTANNQEYNRSNNNSHVSERAMRELYLRGFEICVKESQPHALMTSYNLLNGVHTSEHRGLTEDILRCEFGFEGIVMTDWVTARNIMNKNQKYAPPCASRIAAAGGDLAMPGEKIDYKDILKSLKNGSLSRHQLEINATRVVAMSRKLVK